MGQRYVPELHDPNRADPEGQKVAALTDEEVKVRFEALIAKIDAESRSECDRREWKKPAG